MLIYSADHDSIGEKIVPLPQEGYITANPIVAGCVMFGREHEQAGILIESAPGHAINPSNELALAELRGQIW